jgi:hypothetical protein
MKAFVLVRGKNTKRLYVFERATWGYMDKKLHHQYEFVADNDDQQVLKQMKSLANEGITNVRKQTY